MTNFTNEIFEKYQVRKTFRQKKAFRKRLTDKMASMGYKVGEERHGLFQRLVNVTVGDPDKAEIIFTAHYDTGVKLPFPNFITPEKPVLFIGFKVLAVMAVVLAAVALQEAVFFITQSTSLSTAVYFVFLLGMLVLRFFGPANRNNANDNTSGVCVMCEALQMLCGDKINEGKTAFVFFDDEEKGFSGSLFYKRCHKKHIKAQTVINFDCVGSGDNILFICSKELINDLSLREKLVSCVENHPQRANAFRAEGDVCFPSSQRRFRKSIEVGAFTNYKLAGLYLGRIHTKRDTVTDEINIELLSRFIKNVAERGKSDD